MQLDLTKGLGKLSHMIKHVCFVEWNDGSFQVLLSCRDMQHDLAGKPRMMLFVNESITDDEFGHGLLLK